MTANNYIQIDGSYGEGGGQILRTALALSAITARPVTIYNIRAKRKNPGLRPQHLKGGQLLAKITGARTTGFETGSRKITFAPTTIKPDKYSLDVASAGAISLVLQTVIPPLVFARGSSHLTLIGGTHVNWAPPFHYLTEVLFPTLKKMGIEIRATLKRWGWYPKGGGEAEVDIQPCHKIRPVELVERGRLKELKGISVAGNLSLSIAERQAESASREIKKSLGLNCNFEIVDKVECVERGSFIFIKAVFENAVAGFSALGERRKPAEKVGKECAEKLAGHLKSKGCIDPHLADQLLIFTAIADGSSKLTTSRITQHMKTSAWVCQKFKNAKILIASDEGRAKIEIFKQKSPFLE